jgi:hypothetical protein
MMVTYCEAAGWQAKRRKASDTIFRMEVLIN